MTSARPGAHLLVECLLAEGVDTLFGIPGVGTLSVSDACVDHPALRHIEVRHEQAAIFMADGYARAIGEPGVALTSNGYNRRSGVDLLPPDFVAVARAFGADRSILDDHSRIGETVAGYVDHGGPVVIEIPNEFAHPGYGAFGTYERK